MNVVVVPHNPNWRQEFAAEAQRVAIAFDETGLDETGLDENALDKNLVEIYHIGSTAIPTIYAKPIVDLLVAVKVITRVDKQNSAMAALGYEAMGELGISGRRFFRKHNREGDRTHHVHAFEATSPQIERHLAFRDYLIAHPKIAHQYSELKQQLAQQYPHDIEGYMDGKNDFIRAIDRKAAEWQTST